MRQGSNDEDSYLSVLSTRGHGRIKVGDKIPLHDDSS